MDYDQIAALANALRESPRLTFVEIRSGETTLRLRRSSSPSNLSTSVLAPPRENKASTAVSAAGTPYLTDITAPVLVTAQLVGVFRHNRPAPLVAGDLLKAEQAVGQIESMRLMNECTAPTGGRVQAVFVQEGQPVEYGQPLFELIPNTEAEK